jgi:membrane protein DedA with SNARE-associated domain
MLDMIIADLTNARLWVVVLIWVAIGVFNKLVYYEAGERGGKAALNKIHGYTPEKADKYDQLYERWGLPLLLLASVPVIGAVITVLGGVGRVAMPVFIVMVVISNLVRNWLIIILSGGVMQLLQ